MKVKGNQREVTEINENQKKSKHTKGTHKKSKERLGNQSSTIENLSVQPAMYTIRKASGKVFGCKITLAQPVGKEIKRKS